MVKVRIVIADKDKIKEKLPSKQMPHVPSKGDRLVYLKRNFLVDEVGWDLELDEVEAVIFVTETK